MDEQFVQGVIGGVLNRHKNRTLDKNRIRTLMVEIAANIDIATQYTNVKEVQKAVDNPLNIEMWKGYKKTIKEEELSKEYLDYWTCEICNDNTHEVDYDYLGNGTNHLGCELKEDELQKKSDKIMEQLEIDFKDYDLSKAESNENSKVDMNATAKRGKK
tara:strand:- start:233 stop:709 length:477 start_codon:yes stop_codon:yes gene_type:complete